MNYAELEVTTHFALLWGWAAQFQQGILVRLFTSCVSCFWSGRYGRGVWTKRDRDGRAFGNPSFPPERTLAPCIFEMERRILIWSGFVATGAPGGWHDPPGL
jgi:hypothetical protein